MRKMFYKRAYGNRSIDKIVRVEETPNYPHDNNTSSVPEKSYALVIVFANIYFGCKIEFLSIPGRNF